MLRRTGLTTMYFTLSQHGFFWLGHTLRMGDEQIPQSLLYSKLVDGRRKRGWPTLRFKDICKCDLKSLNVGTDKWEELANDWDKWRSSVYRKCTGFIIILNKFFITNKNKNTVYIRDI